MSSKELHYPDQSSQFLSLSDILQSTEYAVSPSLPGTLYDISRLVDTQGNVYAVKTLMPDIIERGKYPSTYTLEQVFTRHQEEHALFLRHMPQFVVPTCFYIDETESGTKYRVIQPWITFGVQYKEAIQNNRTIPVAQLPCLEERIQFIQGFVSLLKDPNVYPRITDTDFFLVPTDTDTTIRLIDTNFLWHPKHHSDGRDIQYNLSRFLFTADERSDSSIKETLSAFERALHFSQW